MYKVRSHGQNRVPARAEAVPDAKRTWERRGHSTDTARPSVCLWRAHSGASVRMKQPTGGTACSLDTQARTPSQSMLCGQAYRAPRNASSSAPGRVRLRPSRMGAHAPASSSSADLCGRALVLSAPSRLPPSRRPPRSRRTPFSASLGASARSLPRPRPPLRRPPVPGSAPPRSSSGYTRSDVLSNRARSAATVAGATAR
jgi:hypothetical protein